MPELPEVEHARPQFLSILGTEEVVAARAVDSIVVPQSHASFASALTGHRIEGIGRVGKNLLVRLEGDRALWFHLGMTGRVVRWREEDEVPRFTRWWIATSKGRLALADARKLGRAVAGPTETVRGAAKLDRLGPDALGVKTGEALAALFAKTKLPIKVALMDQARLAGIGNIQAAEALWLAKVHPDTPVPDLTPKQWGALADAMQETLRRSIESMKGDEEVVYVEAGGPNPFQVYDREGERCPRCKRGTIVREVSRGRSTYLCPTCQGAEPTRGQARRPRSSR